jgi:hypothetical protein
MLSYQQNTINNMKLIVLDSVIKFCIVSALVEAKRHADSAKKINTDEDMVSQRD